MSIVIPIVADLQGGIHMLEKGYMTVF